jgi:hypothetical protein
VKRSLSFSWLKTRKASLFLVALVLVAAVALAAWWYFYKKSENNPDTKTLAENSLKLRRDQIEKLNLDVDQDGLRDWEETIFQTDPNNPDTDGDGTKDGEEINQSRDPLIKGPNDKIAPREVEKKTASNFANVTSDFTQKFLRNPIAQILAGGQATVDPKAIEAYTGRLLSQSVLADGPKIEKGDITIVENKTEFIAKYFIGFESIFKTLRKENPESELDIAVEAFRTQNYEPLQKIDKSIKAYEKTITLFRKMNVPSGLVDFHLFVMDYFAKFKKSAELMRRAEEDPIQAMLAVNERVAIDKKFGELLSSIQSELEKIEKQKQ